MERWRDFLKLDHRRAETLEFHWKTVNRNYARVAVVRSKTENPWADVLRPKNQKRKPTMKTATAGRGVLLIAAVGLLAAVAPARADSQIYSKHVVVAQEARAAQAGRDVLRRGGNAIDAAVATAFALAVTLPEAGNLGGGGFIVAYLARGREVITVDFREMAPRSATPEMYLGPDRKLRPRYRAGAQAAAIPGTVRGLGLAHFHFGTLSWPDLVLPAARLAREGFPISADLAGSLNRQLRPRVNDPGSREARDDFGKMADFPESVAAFQKPDHTPWRAGDLLVQRDLASTLELIAAHGPDEFYTGRTARMLADYMAACGGFVTAEDLKAYRARLRLPVHTSFRGCEVFGVGPPSSGGIVLCQMLNILERYDLKQYGRDSPQTLHRVTEAMRRAFFTRATRLGDPDFVPIPIAELTSKDYADGLAGSIGEQATPSARLGPIEVETAEGIHTTHLSTIDQDGNAVALTYTLEDSYGAKCVVPGGGFLLNNEMGDFNLIPGRTDTAGLVGTPPNRIAPHKRVLSSQSPALVLKDGRVRVVTGSPGGRTIPNTTLWIVLNLLEFGMSPRAAIDAPRTHHQWFPDTLVLEGRTWSDSTRASLRGMGYALKQVDHQGCANTIVVDEQPRRLHGLADQRRATAEASGD
jgi:gamma-glutamyltranspeptidase/glutathione hydrolase